MLLGGEPVLADIGITQEMRRGSGQEEDQAVANVVAGFDQGGFKGVVVPAIGLGKALLDEAFVQLLVRRDLGEPPEFVIDQPGPQQAVLIDVDQAIEDRPDQRLAEDVRGGPAMLEFT